jgi:hypothetical protein
MNTDIRIMREMHPTVNVYGAGISFLLLPGISSQIRKIFLRAVSFMSVLQNDNKDQGS